MWHELRECLWARRFWASLFKWLHPLFSFFLLYLCGDKTKKQRTKGVCVGHGIIFLHCINICMYSLSCTWVIRSHLVLFAYPECEKLLTQPTLYGRTRQWQLDTYTMNRHTFGTIITLVDPLSHNASLQLARVTFFLFRRPNLIIGLSGWRAPDCSLRTQEPVPDWGTGALPSLWQTQSDPLQVGTTNHNVGGLACILGLTNPHNQSP